MQQRRLHRQTNQGAKKITAISGSIKKEANMIFEILYLLAKFRGLFPENNKICGLVISTNDKETIKALYRRGSYIPYHITNTTTLVKREDK